MRLGIIDLGTNSIRFDAYDMHYKKPRLLYRERLMVRLGEDVFTRGRMSKAAFDRTVQAFVSFKYTAKQLGVSKIVAVATSAARQASDRQRLITTVKKRAGIDIRIISGEEEAGFIARGIICREKNLPERVALLDIGGGSIEVSFFKKRQILWGKSFALGTLRIAQIFPLNEEGVSLSARLKRVKELRKHVHDVLDQETKTQQWIKVSKIIGSSGTVKALVRLQQGESKNRKLTRPFLRGLIRRMLPMTRIQLLKIPNMDPTRVDMILGGAVVLEEVMKKCSAPSIQLSDFALREGVLDEEASLITDFRTSALGNHLRDLRQRLSLSLTDKEYAGRIVTVADQLFDTLKRLHKLPNKWKVYLAAAALLENTGKVISPIKHSRHSYYIVANLDFPWLEEQDRDILSHMCLWHSEGKINKRDLAFLKNRALKDSFLKALAILRIANALVWHDRCSVKISGARMKAGEVILNLRSESAIKLLSLRVEEKGKLFSRVFKRSIVIDAR